MKTVFIEYNRISPLTLDEKIRAAFPHSTCFCSWLPANEQFYEFSVWNVDDVAKVEDILAEYV